jgi:hypothetical protein
MPGYDQTLFNPPAPVAIVTVRDPVNGTASPDVLMLIDSGADATLLPENVANDLGLRAEEGDLYELVGFNETRSLSPAVRADLLFLGRTFSGRFLLSPNQWGILGRNVLNHLPILLDGPRMEWGESVASSSA